MWFVEANREWVVKCSAGAGGLVKEESLSGEFGGGGEGEKKKERKDIKKLCQGSGGAISPIDIFAEGHRVASHNDRIDGEEEVSKKREKEGT
ncbi:hypothetical protein CPSG_01165 [Coccidioides posadasii str. Silveira]|uniref:Uncharacterized protein n=1 Tax=Coccidioides posadasii (strain RMSCC 757 / Silveira) TaxID=443226 RepID=E9CRI8_COCPS|nr:hypothetical protein CPSG_01165 [Coccidioides posadasii str. Silveira]